MLVIDVIEPTPLLSFPLVIGDDTDLGPEPLPGGPLRKNSASSDVVLLGEAIGSRAFNFGAPDLLLGRLGSDRFGAITG